MKKFIESDKEHDDSFETSIDWNKVNTHVRRLQDRIYRATDEGNFEKVKDLQKLLINSYYVKLYAIRQITIINTGKTTPGIDGRVFLSNLERSILLKELLTISLRNYKPPPVKQVGIPKADGRKRYLGIPTIFDRCIQAMVKLAMEPVWEHKFHHNSFGFRPGRNCQDAIEQIRDTIRNGKGNYILDADLSGYFDNIAHEDILQMTYYFRGIIMKWLKAGVIIDGKLVKTIKGTPQGGVISPLLANIALNDMDYMFNGNIEGNRVTMVRYADDFVILTKYKTEMKEIYAKITKFLENKGLTLNTEKTKIIRKEEGFDFLGFHIVHYPGRIIWIQASRKNIKRFTHEIKTVLDTNKQMKTDLLILMLNRKILGWARYYQYSRIHNIFPHVDAIIWRWTWKWCSRRHPRKGRRWIASRYYQKIGTRNWMLCGDTFSLARVTDIRHKTYNWRVGKKSPLNPDERKWWEIEDHVETTLDYII